MRSTLDRRVVGRATAHAPAAAATRVSWTDTILQEVLTPTYWFEAAPDGAPYSLTVQFRGRRTRVNGKPSARDAFVRDETVDVLPGTGLTSVTARVGGINPGKWSVTAEPMARDGVRFRGRPSERVDPTSAERPWPWVVVRPLEGMLLKTAVGPFARVPGVIPGVYSGLVALGMLVGVLVLLAIAGTVGIAQGPLILASLGALFFGLLGGKGLFIIQQRGKRFDGWCIQGFITALAVSGAILLVVSGLPIGTVLNAAAPALFLGVAVGRPGCFLAGCCGGRATTAWWGLWGSDQRVGTRRIPTQLLEAVLGLIIGVTTLSVFFAVRTILPGALLAGAIAAYVLGRQFILPLRSDPRMRGATGRLATVTLAALVLGLDVLLSTAF